MGLIDEVNRLAKDLDAKKQEALQASTALDGYKVRDETVQAQAEEVKISQINSEIDKLDAQLREKQSKVDQAEKQIAKLKRDLSDAQQQLNTMRTREGIVLSEIDHMTTSIRTLQSDLGGGGGIF